MSDPISTPPWDLAAGNRWTIQSEDHRIANDRGNETVVDAQGNVVAYVSGNNDEGGNGQLLAAAPALVEALKRMLELVDHAASKDPHSPWCNGVHSEQGQCEGDYIGARIYDEARAALKQAGQS